MTNATTSAQAPSSARSTTTSNILAIAQMVQTGEFPEGASGEIIEAARVLRAAFNTQVETSTAQQRNLISAQEAQIKELQAQLAAARVNTQATGSIFEPTKTQNAKRSSRERYIRTINLIVRMRKIRRAQTPWTAVKGLQTMGYGLARTTEVLVGLPLAMPVYALGWTGRLATGLGAVVVAAGMGSEYLSNKAKPIVNDILAGRLREVASWAVADRSLRVCQWLGLWEQRAMASIDKRWNQARGIPRAAVGKTLASVAAGTERAGHKLADVAQRVKEGAPRKDGPAEPKL